MVEHNIETRIELLKDHWNRFGNSRWVHSISSGYDCCKMALFAFIRYILGASFVIREIP